MKKNARMLSLLLVLALTLFCFPGALAQEAQYNIGIIQLVQHPALDAATLGFQEALQDKLGEENVAFDYQNAQGDSANCTMIVNGFVAQNVDLILANATAALQAAFTGTETIPILGTSITDFASALDLDDFDGTTGYNVSGTSDLAPLDEQAALLNALFPAESHPVVGLLYCSAEPNSAYQIGVIEPALQQLGYETQRFGFSDSNDIASVVTNAVSICDVLYIPTDNTAANNTEVINNVALPAGVPIIAGEENLCAGCGVATLSIDYYDIGYAAGEMAYEILVNGADVAAMPIQYAPIVTKKFNEANCAELGVVVPEDYVVIEGTQVAE